MCIKCNKIKAYMCTVFWMFFKRSLLWKQRQFNWVISCNAEISTFGFCMGLHPSCLCYVISILIFEAQSDWTFIIQK